MQAMVFVVTSAYGLTATLADDLMDAAPLLRNVNSANPGLETIMPLFVNTGVWHGDIPNKHTVSFRVFRSGSTTHLYSSAARSVTPPRPCTNPVDSDNDSYDLKHKFVSIPGSTWLHLVEGHSVSCVDNSNGNFVTKEGTLVFVYSANLAAANGAVWTKTYNNRWLDAFQGVDTDGNGTLDKLMLLMAYQNTKGGYNEQVVVLNPTTGATISSASYEVERYN